MSKKDEPAIRALKDHESWATCSHVGATPTNHSCPRCGGTLRRCCDSLVGVYEHREECPEVARRSVDVA